MRKLKNWLCRLILKVQQREDFRRDHAERMKFIPPDLRRGEHVFYWQEDPSKIQQGRKSGKWLKVEIIAVKGPGHLSIQVRPYFMQTYASKGDCWILWIRKNFWIRVSEQERLCCGSLVKVKLMFGICSRTTNSYLSAIFDRQRRQVAAPTD